jgi:hypothetical protein
VPNRNRVHRNARQATAGPALYCFRPALVRRRIGRLASMLPNNRVSVARSNTGIMNYFLTRRLLVLGRSSDVVGPSSLVGRASENSRASQSSDAAKAHDKAGVQFFADQGAGSDLLLKSQGRKWTSKATTMIPISAPAIATINTSRMGRHPSVCAPNPLRPPASQPIRVLDLHPTGRTARAIGRAEPFRPMPSQPSSYAYLSTTSPSPS